MKFKNLSLLGFLFLSGCSYQIPGLHDYGCTAAHGGDPRRCWQALNLNKDRPETGPSYHSAGTMVLASATCVSPTSQWWFHGGHHPVTKQISEEGNDVLRSAYNRKYPALTQYLDSTGALKTTKWTKMTGSDLNKFGVPMCVRGK
jgi:hypothetical protein